MRWTAAGKTASERGARRASRVSGGRRRRALLALLTLVGLGVAPASAAQAVPGSDDPSAAPSAASSAASDWRPAVVGRIVRAIELRSDVPQEDADQLLRLVTLEPGKALRAEDVHSSILNLHARGVAGEIEYLSRLEDGEVVAIFVLWGQVLVDEVRLEGELGIGRQRLGRILEQRPAEPLVEDRVIRTLYRLQDLYPAEGYFSASVRVDVDVDRTSKRAVVTYEIESGPRAQIASVELEGEGVDALSNEEMLRVVKADPGDRYRRQGVEADADLLRRWLVRSGWRKAEVEAPREELSDDRRTVSLTYPVTLGPRVEVEVVGASLERLLDDRLLPFMVEEGYDSSLLLQTEQRLKSHFQSQGHYRVSVDAREERVGEDLLRIVVEVDQGETYLLREVRFAGNERIPTARLDALISTGPRKKLVPGSGRLVDEVLRADLDNLRSFYALEGFSGSPVGSARIEEQGTDLTVTIPIEEGPRRRVVDVEIEGAEALSPEELLADLVVAPGGPFHPQRLQASLDRIRSRYEAKGYDTTQVSSSLDWNDENTLVDVLFQVLEGPQARVERVIVRGNRKTHTPTLLRWIGLEPGEPVSTRRLLEVQRDLYRRGIFSRVEVATSSATRYAPQRSVVVRVEEGSTQRLFYGLGYDSEDGIRGLVGYSRSNLFGRGYSSQFDLRVSQRESQARALLLQPSIGRFDIPVTYSIFRVEQEEASFDSLRQGGQVEARRLFGSSSVGLLAGYRIVQLSNVAPGLEEIEIDRDLRDVEIATIGPNVFLDRRDDPVDPSHGWSGQVRTEYAFPFLNAQTEYFKLFTQETGYLDLGRVGVIAGSVRFGAIEPRGSGFVDPTLPEGLASRLVPISERFFAGGRTSHRAYRRDRLGIAGESVFGDVEVGGNGLFLTNLELRFPFTSTIGATVFADSGNVWADWRSIDPAQLKTGVGFGGRYLSPIGPLRVEIGWKLDREPGEDPFVVFLSFGNPF